VSKLCPQLSPIRGVFTEQQYDLYREYRYFKIASATGNLVKTTNKVKGEYMFIIMRE